MATTVDELKILIRAETKGLRQDLKKVNSSLGRTEKKVGKVGLGFGRLAKIMGAIGLARMAGQVVQTSRTFEDLGATLRAVTGSAESAAVSMDLVRKFTAGTTFQLENVSEAFITLLNAGITPTSDVLKDFGNIAAAFGKDITQMTQAVFNATTGEVEMLKQFGIKAKMEGDKITMIFREKETQIGRNSEEIVGYLRGIAQENYATALEERLNTVSGAFSNMGDTVSELFNAIGEGGLNSVLIESTKKLIDLGTQGKEVGLILGQLLKMAFDKLKLAIRFVTENMSQLIGVTALYIAIQIGVFVVNTAMAFNALRKQIGLTKIAMLALNKVSKGNILLLLGIAILALTGGLEKLGEQVQKVLDLVGNKLKNAFDFGDTVDETVDDIDELNALLEKIAAQMKGDIPAAIDATIDGIKDMKNVVIEGSQAFTKDFVDALLNAENALDAFKNFAKNIVSQIIAIFLQMEIVNRILAAIFPNMGIHYGGIITPAGGGPPPPTVTPPPPAGAGGRGVGYGAPTLVGERGPELFFPYSAGKIMNNADSRGFGGGQPIIVNQSISFSTGIVPTVRAEVTKMLPQIADVTKASVFEAASRGGQFGKMLRGGAG